MTAHASLTQLQTGLTQLALSATSATQQHLMAYLALLEQWNTAYNLTAVQTQPEMVIRHLLDSLAIAPYLKGDQIIDIGTGPGLPGIPLALYFPDRHFTLLDSNGKKCRFLQHVKQLLPLANVTIVQTRAEKFLPTHCFTSIVSRAFSSLADMIARTRHLLCHLGYFLAMKGQCPDEELAALPADCFVEAIYPITVPYLHAQRHLVSITLRDKEHA